MLVLRRQNDQVAIGNLDSPRLTLGRDVSNDIVLDESSVSGFHALILCEQGRFIVADLGSTNGSFVNNQRVTGRAEFFEGNTLSFGSANFVVGDAVLRPEKTVIMPAAMSSLSALSHTGEKPETVADAISPHSMSPPTEKFCSQCGAHLSADSRFCEKCGRPCSGLPGTANMGAAAFSPRPGGQANFSAPAQKTPWKWVWVGVASAFASAAAVTGGWLFLNNKSDDAASPGFPLAAIAPQTEPVGDASPLLAPVTAPARQTQGVSTAGAPLPVPRSSPLPAAPMPNSEPPPMSAMGLMETAPPPPLELATEPEFIVAPSDNDYVYMAAGLTGLYFLGGQWYRHHDGHWFRSPSYNGRWNYLNSAAVPRSILRVPPEYPRHIGPEHQRIHYGELEHNWRHWDQQKHWNNHGWYKNELRENVRNERLRSIEHERTVERERHRLSGTPPVTNLTGQRHTPPPHVQAGAELPHSNLQNLQNSQHSQHSQHPQNPQIPQIPQNLQSHQSPQNPHQPPNQAMQAQGQAHSTFGLPPRGAQPGTPSGFINAPPHPMQRTETVTQNQHRASSRPEPMMSQPSHAQPPHPPMQQAQQAQQHAPAASPEQKHQGSSPDKRGESRFHNH